jgi:hypothetical protein
MVCGTNVMTARTTIAIMMNGSASFTIAISGCGHAGDDEQQKSRTAASRPIAR